MGVLNARSGPSTWEPVLSASRPPLVSVLPSSSSAGDEIYFQNSLMYDQGIIWHLRRAAGTYWECLGGNPLVSEQSYDEPVPISAGYVSLAAAGPAFTLPFPGMYQIGHGAFITTTTYGGTRTSPRLGSTAATHVYAAGFVAGDATGAAASAWTEILFVLNASQLDVELQYNSQTAVGRVSLRKLTARLRYTV